MKKLPFFSLLSALMIVSCSTDDSSTELQTLQDVNAPANALQRTVAFSAANNANPFDSAGRAYNAVLNEYYAFTHDGHDPEVIIGNLGAIANGLPDFELIKTNGQSVTIFYENIERFLNDEYSFGSVLTNSGLSNAGKTAMLNFMTTLQNTIETKSTAEVHAYLLQFENLLPQSNLTATDSKIILTTASIIRYENASKADKDKDWLFIRTRIAAAIDGLSQSTATAVLMCSALEIIQHNNN